MSSSCPSAYLCSGSSDNFLQWPRSVSFKSVDVAWLSSSKTLTSAYHVLGAGAVAYRAVNTFVVDTSIMEQRPANVIKLSEV